MAWDYATGSVPLLLSDTSSTFYIYGPGDTPIEQIKTAGNTYLMGDQLGSTILLTNNAGLVKGTWTYDAYGKTTSYTGTLDTTLLYNGQYQDTESGLYYLRARYYEPQTAQFTTRDPLRAWTRDTYGYAAREPLSHTDPTGRSDYPGWGEMPQGGGEGYGPGDGPAGGEGTGEGTGEAGDGYGENGTAPSEFASGGEGFCDSVEDNTFETEVEQENEFDDRDNGVGRPSLSAIKIAQHANAEGHEIPGVDPDELDEYVEDVMREPGQNKRGGGKIWWDSRHGAVVIQNPDGYGTVFVPDPGYQYYLDWIK